MYGPHIVKSGFASEKLSANDVQATGGASTGVVAGFGFGFAAALTGFFFGAADVRTPAAVDECDGATTRGLAAVRMRWWTRRAVGCAFA